MRKLILLFALLTALTMPVSCGAQTIKVKNPDRTTAVIEYTSAVPLQRAPYFELHDGKLHMTFNGYTWYIAYFVSAEERAGFEEYPVAAHSTNLTVYRLKDDAETDEPPYLLDESDASYAYLLDLDGTDDAYVCFLNVQPPQTGSYANDFTTSAAYRVDDAKGGETIYTVPDLTWFEDFPAEQAAGE